MGRAKGKRTLGKQGRGWEDNIKMDLNEAGNWTDLSQDRNQWRACVRAVIILRVFLKLISCCIYQIDVMKIQLIRE